MQDPRGTPGRMGTLSDSVSRITPATPRYLAHGGLGSCVKVGAERRVKTFCDDDTVMSSSLVPGFPARRGARTCRPNATNHNLLLLEELPKLFLLLTSSNSE